MFFVPSFQSSQSRLVLSLRNCYRCRGLAGVRTGVQVMSSLVGRENTNKQKSSSISPSKSNSRGALIVFEGVDRSGKTTQASKLVERLQKQGRDAELWKFPDRTTKIGKMIDSYLKCDADLDDNVIHLLFATNRWEKRQQMLKKLRQGTTLILDRYAYSGVAFSSAKRKEGLSLEWCKAPEVGLPSPDVVFFMQLPLDNLQKRKGFGEERYENTEFQKQVYNCFMDLKDENWVFMNAQQSIEQIHEQVVLETTQIIETCKKGKALRQLWDGKIISFDNDNRREYDRIETTKTGDENLSNGNGVEKYDFNKLSKVVDIGVNENDEIKSHQRQKICSPAKVV
eukprot:TRINITY_DN988_c0_g1_i2.p1 TRINITY_DN988_c0_g1~~TRINITY_DN988_c0_g1_i2.p1  ORF type:complete len:340 (+),score=37.74 TRINITY_DN988_c0_g1_i2:78-1097(+)